VDKRTRQHLLNDCTIWSAWPTPFLETKRCNFTHAILRLTDAWVFISSFQRRKQVIKYLQDESKAWHYTAMYLLGLNLCSRMRTIGSPQCRQWTCELHHSFEHFHWTGFYRTVKPNVLKIGPYQGGHGCLVIPFDKGICGAAARTGETQDVPDVHARSEHIACSSTTLSEVVVPIKNSDNQVVAVLDLDSDLPAAFSPEDISFTEHLCQYLGAKYF
jgi:GAF domain-containing protein